MTDLAWNKAFDLLMENEGGYVNDPDDSGGETKFGICKRSYPDEDIKNLTIDRAKEIYRRDFWLRAKCDRYPDALSVAVFDYAVNSGVSRAIKDMQAAMNLKADGVAGNQTIGAANRLPLRPVLEAYLDKRLNFLTGLKGWKKYGGGWGKRVQRVKKVCEGLI